MKEKTMLLGTLSLAYGITFGDAFVTPARRSSLHRASSVGPTLSRTTSRHLTADWTSLTTAIEYFDGSQIVDPVVVSNVFWSSLATKFISLIFGQLIATIVFGFLASLAAQQIGNLGSFISDKVFKQDQVFRKMPDPTRERTIEPDFGKLVICILIDVIGSSSELIPILGEATDVVWAPIAGLILRSLYSSNILFALEFAEEILPFTDILPLATICWVVDTYFGESSLAKLLNIGVFSYTARQPVGDSSVTDVPATFVDNEKLIGPDDDEWRRRQI